MITVRYGYQAYLYIDIGSHTVLLHHHGRLHPFLIRSSILQLHADPRSCSRPM